jgi:hypothetical protein
MNDDVVNRPLGLVWSGVFFAMCVLWLGSPTSAHAQPKKKPLAADPAPAASADTGGKKTGKPKVFDFTGLDINGRLRTPQLLYFLERANEELERASLERRSFIPEMIRTIDEEKL